MNFLLPFGASCGAADFKTYCEDFKVTEVGKFIPCGEGEHLWLWIEKTNTNTAWVAEELSKQSGIKLRDVSYAGRKDKVAITQQWFSLYDPKKISDEVDFNIPNCNILKKIRHTQKLRIGNLLGNKFEIRLRNFSGNYQQLLKRIQEIETRGFPNYFGPQRFGRDMNNLPKAIAWVEKGAGRLRREQRSIYFSVLRSYLFNLILSERITQNNWDKVILGELAQLTGSHSVFLVDSENIESALARCGEFDISPTAPLMGSGNMLALDDAAELELAVLNEHDTIVDFLLKEASLARRALRVRPEKFIYSQEADDVLLEFTLPAGCYATILLSNLLEVIESSVL